ncbi:MAG: hypothetical protein ACKVG7_08075, partial [Flavobacteriales bacterium]
MRFFLIIIFIFPTILIAQSGDKNIFITPNSLIPEINITTIATDNTGLNWIGTLNGLICYNGRRSHTITTKNSKLPSNKILCIEIINNTNYIGTSEGLVIIKNNNWEVYTTENSALPSNKIRQIKVSNNIVWIATSAGLVKYENDFEVVLSRLKNNINDDDFISLNVDDNETVWLGTHNGLYNYKESIWRIFTTQNSKLPNNHIWSIEVDSKNNKWVGTKKGIAVITKQELLLY